MTAETISSPALVFEVAFAKVDEAEEWSSLASSATMRSDAFDAEIRCVERGAAKPFLKPFLARVSTPPHSTPNLVPAILHPRWVLRRR